MRRRKRREKTNSNPLAISPQVADTLIWGKPVDSIMGLVNCDRTQLLDSTHLNRRWSCQNQAGYCIRPYKWSICFHAQKCFWHTNIISEYRKFWWFRLCWKRFSVNRRGSRQPYWQPQLTYLISNRPENSTTLSIGIPAGSCDLAILASGICFTPGT